MDSKTTSPTAPNPLAAMLHNTSVDKEKGTESSNTASDMFKSVQNKYNIIKEGENLVLESSDTINHFLKSIPLFLAEVLKNDQSRSIVAETTGADGSDPVSQAVTTNRTLESHLVDIIDMIPPEPSTLPVTSIAERYTRSMLKSLIGYPLYDPKPFSELSKEYPRNGVNIGDVGFIRGDGTFDFLFNICPSKNASINPPNLPDGFSLETAHEFTTRDRELLPRNTSLFERPITRTNSGEYICEGLEGAILELPQGAMLDEATNMLPFEKLAARHAVQWYEYTMTRGRKISNGSLYLITSSTKCTQWGTAVFDRTCASGQGLNFDKKKSRPVGKTPAKYQWKGSRAFPTKVFDPIKGSTPNQCVFLGGYKITIRQDIFDNLYSDQLRGSNPAMRSSSLQAGSSTTRSSGGRGNDPMSKTLTGGGLFSPITMSTPIKSGEVILFASFNSPIVHPSDLINAALMSQNQGAKVALTHDDVWCHLLRDNFPKLNYATLLNIARSYTITVDEYECISLQKISDSSNVLDRSSRPLPEDYTPVSSLISLTFPRELVERILLLLDPKSILICRLVNRRFNEIIRSSTLLQYALACKAADVIDNPRSTISCAERLEALEKREDAWRTLKPVFKMTIKVKHQPSAIYGLTEGAYFLDDHNGKDLHYCKLPSSPKDNPQWFKVQGHGPEEGRPENFVNFVTAVYEHDLIIKIISSDIGDQVDMQRHSLDLVLLKFSTGEYHTLARNPRIHVQRSPSAELWVSPTIVGDNIALVVHSEDDTVPDKLFIFDWKTGHKRLQHETTENAYSDLIFISPEILLVPNFVQSHFEVWHLPPSHPNPKPPVQILALQIPAISPDCSLVSISCDGEPNPFLHSMPYLPQRPFFPSPENSIIVANLRFSSPFHRRRRASYTLIMHRRALLDTIEKWTSPSVVEQQEDLPTWLMNEITVHNTADPEDGPVRLGAQSKLLSIIPRPRPSPRFCGAPASPASSSSISSGLSTTSSPSLHSFLQVKWADWGPPISRWFPVKEIQAQFITSFGQRCAFLFPNPRNRRKTMVTVVDFNPHNFRRMKLCPRGEGEDKGSTGNGGDEKEDEGELEILDHENIFSEEVYMGLKCVVYHTPDQYDFNQLLMDEERLLGLKLNREQNVERVEVLYFG
ncbi:hypothetical protein M378DRAFT_163905 [Amanita muscaria Koide BX008]|uniref:F-box domain-containing protein n=1 Tax=Amanita muscaria (strain Koide BX008) TaxID=946122 RepID=A0A0C2WQJ7_AMAMK|nr:hypothetical protein M378DRAFT_163905 [Amanita muscaria Koide BX008]